MDTVQMLCILHYVGSFLDIFVSDHLPRSIMKTCTVFVNADTQTEGGSHCLAVHDRPKSSSAYYFDLYGILRLVSNILAFIRRNCTS